MKRVLLLATTTGYQTRMFAEAASNARRRAPLRHRPLRSTRRSLERRRHSRPLSRRMALGRFGAEGRRCPSGERRARGRRSAHGDGRLPVAAARTAGPSAGSGRRRARQAPVAREAQGRGTADALVHHRAGRHRCDVAARSHLVPGRGQADGAVGKPRRDSGR